MIQLKGNVKMGGIQPEILLAIVVANDVYARYGYETVVTSANDSKHMEGSLHFVGQALDFRTKHLASPELKQTIATEIQAALGTDYDVVVEKDHLHVEFDLKD